MTNEQIIIDGVDVSGCMYFDYDEGYNQETEEFVKGACKCITAHDSYGEFMYYGICKDRNCYYKQLKRKEQECEELKEQLTILNDEDVVVEITVEQFEEYKKLKAENEELKRQIKVKGNILKLTNEAKNEYLDQNNKLKQALQEIKEIANICLNQDVCAFCKYSDNCYIEDEEIPTYDVCKLILQKIKECEVNVE